jgi:hypothetical protein
MRKVGRMAMERVSRTPCTLVKSTCICSKKAMRKVGRMAMEQG